MKCKTRIMRSQTRVEETKHLGGGGGGGLGGGGCGGDGGEQYSGVPGASRCGKGRSDEHAPPILVLSVAGKVHGDVLAVHSNNEGSRGPQSWALLYNRLQN